MSEPRILLRIVMFIVTAAGLLISPGICRADTQCPWLNATTAGGFLGGDVVMRVTDRTPLGDAACEFIRRQGSTVSMLNIAVHTMNDPAKDFASYLSQCNGQTIPLKAIGTEAVQCIPKGRSAKHEEEVIGRVRERTFILIVHRDKSKPAAREEGLPNDTRNIAEQVAGSLF